MRRRLSDAEAERVLEAERKRRRQWLSDVPIFAAVASQDNAEEFLTAVAEKLEVKTVGRKECVVSKGEFGAEMYFIVRGEAEVLAELGDAPFAQLGDFYADGLCAEPVTYKGDRLDIFQGQEGCQLHDAIGNGAELAQAL